MKVYPIIYGRTKYVDYLPDFLVRPYDLETKEAFNYVSASMDELNPFGEIRYCVFATCTYTIAGISCYLSNLAEICGTKSDEYVRDAEGRLIAGFIGIAIKKDGTCLVPYIDENLCWTMYKKYIGEQWQYPCDVHAVLLQENDLVEVKRCGKINEPKVIDKYQDKIIVEDGGADNVTYFIREVSLEKSKGYLSSISKVNLLMKKQFEHVSVTPNVLDSIKKTNGKEMVSNVVANVSDSSASAYGQVRLSSVSKSKISSDTVLARMRNSASEWDVPPYSLDDSYLEEKKNSFRNPLWVIGAIIGAVIIMLLIIC